MDIQGSMDMGNGHDDGRSGTGSASPSSDGSPNGSGKSIPLMGSMFDEADPINLCRAICLVYSRRDKDGDKPGRDKDGDKPGRDTLLINTRRDRPQLVAEVERQWCVLTGNQPEDDLFPYHESYVIRKWVQFRKQSELVKDSWIAAAGE